MDKNTRKFFQPVGCSWRHEIDGVKYGKVNMSSLTVDEARDLWDRGFPNLALTREGASQLYKGKKVSEVCALIKKANSSQDVMSLMSLKPKSSTVQTAGREKLDEIYEAEGQ